MSEKRIQLMIKKDFQKSMILEVMLMVFTLINAIVIASFILVDTIADVHDLKLYFGIAVAVLEVIGFFVVYQFNLRASHRIAGPLYSLEQSLKSIEAGELGQPIRFRDTDHFHEIGDQLNNTVDELRDRIDSAKSLALAIQKQNSVDSDLIDQLVEELSYFKTEDYAQDCPTPLREAT